MELGVNDACAGAFELNVEVGARRVSKLGVFVKTTAEVIASTIETDYCMERWCAVCSSPAMLQWSCKLQ